MKQDIADTDLDNDGGPVKPSASKPVGNTDVITPAEPDPTVPDITPAEPDPTKPDMGNPWENRLRARKA